MKSRRLIRRFRMNEGAATAIEYALIATLIAVVIIGAVTSVGTNLNATFSEIAHQASHLND